MKRAFDEGLEAIQKKHQTFFDETPSKYAPEDSPRPSTIGEFILLQYNSESASIAPSEDLPIDIAEEVREVFKRTFSA
jgi:hypothetical protein